MLLALRKLPYIDARVTNIRTRSRLFSIGPRIIAASNKLNLKEAYYSKLISLSAYILSFVAGSPDPDLFLPACDPPKAESFSVREKH